MEVGLEPHATMELLAARVSFLRVEADVATDTFFCARVQSLFGANFTDILQRFESGQTPAGRDEVSAEAWLRPPLWTTIVEHLGNAEIDVMPGDAGGLGDGYSAGHR